MKIKPALLVTSLAISFCLSALIDDAPAAFGQAQSTSGPATSTASNKDHPADTVSRTSPTCLVWCFSWTAPPRHSQHCQGRVGVRSGQGGRLDLLRVARSALSSFLARTLPSVFTRVIKPNLYSTSQIRVTLSFSAVPRICKKESVRSTLFQSRDPAYYIRLSRTRLSRVLMCRLLDTESPPTN